MVDGKPLTKQQIMLQRFENTVALVDADVNGVQPLDYSELLLEMKTRRGHTKLSELLSSCHDELEGLDKISATIDSPVFHIAGDLLSFFANMLRVLGFHRKDKPLTLGEKVITGLCFASISLTVTSLVLGLGVAGIGLATLGLILTGMAVGRSIISLVKFIQTVREKDNELSSKKQDALNSRGVVLQRIAEINASNSENEADKLSGLRQAVDQYVIDAYVAHQLRAAIEHRRNKITNRINFVMKGVIIAGAVLLFFMPLVGAIMTGAAGLVAMATLAVGWIHRRQELKKHAVEDAKVIAAEAPLAEAAPTIDSTTKEMLALSLHAPSEVSHKGMDEQLDDSSHPTEEVVIPYSKGSNIREESDVQPVVEKNIPTS